MAARCIGGYAFNDALNRVRNASAQARDNLRRIIDETPGPQTTALLIAKTAVRLGEIDSAAAEIERIASGLRKN